MDALRDQSCRSRFNGKASPGSASGDGNPVDFAKERKISHETGQFLSACSLVHVKPLTVD